MLAKYLQDNKISIYSLSKHCDISYSTMFRIVKGIKPIEKCNISVLEKISKYLNITIDELCQVFKFKEKISKNLYPYFWDVDPSKLDVEKHKIFIISRLLCCQAYNGFIFVMRNYSYEEIREVGKFSRNLTPKVALFLSNCYSIPKNEMNYFKLANHEWR